MPLRAPGGMDTAIGNGETGCGHPASKCRWNRLQMGLRHLSCSAPSLRLGIRPVYAGVYASKQCSRSLDVAKLKNRTHLGTCRSFERAARMLVESNPRLLQGS